MTTEIAPAAETPASDGAAETPRQRAERIAEAAKVEHNLWGQRHAAERERVASLDREEHDIVSRLAELRARKLAGEDTGAAVAKLVSRRKSLVSQREEAAELAAVAEQQERNARAALEAAAEEAAREQIVGDGQHMASRSEELYVSLETHMAALIADLEEFATLSEASRRMSRLGPVGPIEFTWSKVPSAALRHRLGFPGAY